MMAFSNLFSSYVQDLFFILFIVNLFASYFKKERLLNWKMDSRMLHCSYPYLFFELQIRRFLDCRWRLRRLIANDRLWVSFKSKQRLLFTWGFNSYLYGRVYLRLNRLLRDRTFRSVSSFESDVLRPLFLQEERINSFQLPDNSSFPKISFIKINYLIILSSISKNIVRQILNLSIRLIRISKKGYSRLERWLITMYGVIYDEAFLI